MARDFRDEAFKPVAKAIGQMTLAWNDLHQTLGVLFWVVSNVANALMPFAVWHSSKSDRGQRDMLRALIDLDAVGYDLNSKNREEVRWILGQVNTLEDLRNDAIHSPMLNAPDRPGGVGVMAHEFGHQRAKKLANKDLVREFNWFYDSVVVLNNYAADIAWSLTPRSAPFPERPQMPSRGDSNESKDRLQA